MDIDNSITSISIIIKFISFGLQYHIIYFRRQNVHLIDLSNLPKAPILYLNQISPKIEVIQNDVKPFFTKQQRNLVFFSCRPLKEWIHMIFSVFRGDQKNGINENNFWKKCLGSRFHFSPSWLIYNKSPHLSAQEGPPTGGHMTTWHCEPPNTITIFMRTLVDLLKWPCIILANADIVRVGCHKMWFCIW